MTWPTYKRVRDQGDHLSVRLVTRDGRQIDTCIAKSFKGEVKDLTKAEYRTLFFRDFELTKPQSLYFFFAGGMGDRVIALESVLALRSLLRKSGAGKGEWIAVMPDKAAPFYRRLVASLKVFDQFFESRAAASRYQPKFEPRLLDAGPYQAAYDQISIGTMWDVYWAKWGLPGKFPGLKAKPAFSSIYPDLRREGESLLRARRITTSREFIVVVPEASSLPHLKSWPTRNWRKLLEGVLRKSNCDIEVITTSASLKAVLGFNDRIRIYDYTQLEGGSDGLRLASIIRRARGVVSIDTGPAVLAGALRTPCITLWGPTTPVFFGHPNNLNLRLSVCPPCGFRQRSILCADNVCMQEIRDGDVLQLTLDMIAGKYLPR